MIFNDIMIYNDLQWFKRSQNSLKTFFFVIADTITSQNIDLFSWDSLCRRAYKWYRNLLGIIIRRPKTNHVNGSPV
jgi:hypothetical protein